MDQAKHILEETKPKGSLRKRVITATLFVLGMLIGIFSGSYSFLILFGLINMICLWEFFTLLLPKKGWTSVIRLIIGMVIGALPYFVAAILYLQLVEIQATNFLSFIIYILPPFFMLFLFELYSGDDQPFFYMAYIVLGLFYIGLPFTLLICLAFPELSYQFDIALGILLLTWTNDTAAYFAGSRYGATPLLPRISPKKTWEGTLGGMSITLLISIPVGIVFPILPWKHWFVFAIFIPILGTLGDLAESMLKRSVKTKDTGQLLPGHGGMLDRFDAFIFILPYATVYLYLMGYIKVLF